MSRYVIRRLLQAIPTFLGVTLITFVIVYSAPGDPVLQLTFTEKAVTLPKEQLRHMMGLDKPIPVQYLTWLIGNDWMRDPTLQARRGILRGDFGTSFIEKRPVSDMFGERLAATLLLMGTATLIGYLVGRANRGALCRHAWPALRQRFAGTRGSFQRHARVLAQPYRDLDLFGQVQATGVASHPIRWDVHH